MIPPAHPSLAVAAALAVVAGSTHAAFPAGPVMLNEVLALNSSAVLVGSAYPDYVELYNPGPDRVDLAGVRLVDGSAASIPLVLPQGAYLEAGARLTLWCDRDAVLPEPRATFGLGASGDRLRLTGPDGSVWDELEFGIQAANLSIARMPEGSGPWQLADPTPGTANQPLPVAAADGLRLNEWMAAPSVGDDWLELFNTAALPVDLSGLVLTDSAARTPANRALPALSFIGARGHLQLFASDLRQPDADHLDFRLSASSETVRLLAHDRTTVIDQVTYGAQSADASQGRSPDGGGTIVPFPVGQSTPGASNLRPIAEIAISEVLSHTDPPLEDAIELLNLTDAPVDLSHWWLSDSAAQPRKYRIPAGTLLPAGGYRVFYEFQFSSGASGFSLNSYEGDEVWLSSGDANGNLNGRATFVRFGALRNGVSAGRVNLSAGIDFAPLERRSFGQDSPSSIGQFRQGGGGANSAARIPAVRLAEIRLPDPESASADATPFLELHNATSATVRLFDPDFPTHAWRLRGAVQFDLPAGLELAPDARLLLTPLNPATDPSAIAEFRRAHAIPDAVLILGPWTGVLPTRARSEFHLELQEPDTPEGPTKPRPGFVPYLRVDRIDYQPAAPWAVATAAAIGEWSLQRSSRPDAHANDPASWSFKRPSPGRSDPTTPPPKPDSDADGLPDAWESQHDLDPANPGDATVDADGDGASNLEEYLAGTHPRIPSDRFALEIRNTPGIPLQLQFRFQAATQRAVVLESRPSILSSPWENRATSPSNAASSTRQITLPLDPAVAGEIFRLRLLTAP